MAKIGINLATGSLQKKDIAIGIDLGTSWGKLAVVHPGTQEPVILREFDGRFRFTVDDPEVTAEAGFYFDRLVSLFAELKARARHILKTNAGKAVIAIPSSYSMSERIATRQAAQLAGIEVLALVNRYKAAATDYASKLNPSEAQLIAVCEREDEEVICTAINVFGSLIQVLGSGRASKPETAVANALSAAAVGVESVRDWLLLQHAPIDGLTDDHLVGFFGRQAWAPVTAEPVALGAAIVADRLDKQSPESKEEDIALSAVQLETNTGLELLFPPNQPLPASVERVFNTGTDRQANLEWSVHQLSALPATVRINDIPAMPAGQPTIAVLFKLDAEGVLSATAVEKKTNLELPVQVEPAVGLTARSLAAKLIEQEDAANLQLALAEREAEQLVADSRRFLARHQPQLTEKEIADIQKGIEELMAIIVFSNKDIVNKNIGMLQAILEPVRARLVAAAMAQAG